MGDDGSSSPANTSELTGDIRSPINCLQKNKNTLIKKHLARESTSTEWTDEKHSLYLKSMEASFVNDLYNSFDLLGYPVEHLSDPKFQKRKHTASRAPSCQFKVLQHGVCEKINFERNRSRSEKLGEPGVLLKNPWIRHFRSPCRHQIVASSTLQGKVDLAADLSSYDSIEVSDQNFVDEENIGEKASHMSYPRRIKTSIAPTQSNDQVVPLAKFYGSSHVTEKPCL